MDTVTLFRGVCSQNNTLGGNPMAIRNPVYIDGITWPFKGVFYYLNNTQSPLDPFEKEAAEWARMLCWTWGGEPKILRLQLTPKSFSILEGKIFRRESNSEIPIIAFDELVEISARKEITIQGENLSKEELKKLDLDIGRLSEEGLIHYRKLSSCDATEEVSLSHTERL